MAAVGARVGVVVVAAMEAFPAVLVVYVLVRSLMLEIFVVAFFVIVGVGLVVGAVLVASNHISLHPDLVAPQLVRVFAALALASLAVVVFVASCALSVAVFASVSASVASVVSSLVVFVVSLLPFSAVLTPAVSSSLP